jgi:hypothetical protein
MLQPRASQHERPAGFERRAHLTATQWSITGTPPPCHGRTASQLLGAIIAQSSSGRAVWHPNSATGRPHGHHIPDGCVWTALSIHAGRWVERAAGDEHVLARQIGRRVEASRPQFPPPRSAHHFSSRSVGRNVLAGHHYADVRRAKENYLHGHSSPLPLGMMVIRIECGV